MLEDYRARTASMSRSAGQGRLFPELAPRVARAADILPKSGEPRARAFGLSILPYLSVSLTADGSECGDGGTLTVYPGANLAEYTANKRYVAYSVPGARRGKIQGFSARSRRRCLNRMAGLRRGAVSQALFITLTYPQAFPDCEVAKRHLHNFLKRLRRKHRGMCAVWRLELQERGAPHFHIILLGVRYLSHKWVAAKWHAVTKSEDPKHLAAGTEVRRARNYRHSVNYLCKYVAKVDQARDQALEGRVWGVWGARELYQPEPLRVKLTGEGAVAAAAYISLVVGREVQVPAIGGRCWFVPCLGSLCDVVAPLGVPS